MKFNFFADCFVKATKLICPTGLPRAKALAAPTNCLRRMSIIVWKCPWGMTNTKNLCHTPSLREESLCRGLTRHCEERSDEAIQRNDVCELVNGLPRSFHSLAVTNSKNCCHNPSLREKRSFSWQSISGKAKRVAFSLVEILVALIIVSVIMAALAPVITKKLASAGITIIGGGSSGNTEAQWGEPRSQSDCDPYNALYIPKVMNGGAKSICASKYNAGDANGPDIPSTVTAVTTAGTYCNSGNCCWQGTTANPSYCTTNDGGYGSNYNGCTRTVCNYPASVAICSSWAPKTKGLEVKTWRLATRSEAQGWVDNQSTLNHKQGANGLQLCSGGMSGGSISSVDGFANCAPANGSGYRYCHGAYGASGSGGSDSCYAHDYWLDGAAELNFAGRSNFEVVQTSSNQHYAFSTRCVTDNVPYPETIGNAAPAPSEPEITTDCASVDENCTLCKGDSCLTCASDYKLTSDGKCEEDKPEIKWKAPTSQKDCDYINAHYFNGACITKINAGDSGGPNIKDIGINVLSTGGSCYNNTCCWRGTTSDGCDSFKTGSYSGCTRTVCTYAAAELACKEYDIEGTKGKWSLPSGSDLTAWVNQIAKDYSGTSSLLTRYLGTRGLDLCSVNGDSRGDGNTNCSYSAAGCYNENSGEQSCDPGYVWGKSTGSTTAYSLRLDYNSAERTTENKYWAFSTRCIIKEVPYEVVEEPTPETDTRTWKTPTSQKDCDQYNAHYFKNTCITKVNAGDSGGPSIDNLNIEKLSVGGECHTNSCCFKGQTAGDGCNTFSTSSYNGCKRTVCNWWAADTICKNYDINGTKGKWTLPSSTHLSYWATQIPLDYSSTSSLLTRFLGAKGLDLCDIEGDSLGDGNGRCSSTGDGCYNLASGETACDPPYVWGAKADDLTAYGIYLKYNEGIKETHDKTWLFSTRCVLTQVEDTGEVEPTPETDTRTWKTPTSQKDCDPYNAHYFKNTCITKANAGDAGGATITNDKISMLRVGQECHANSCCWTGNTASSACSTFTTSGYSGCTRTVCTWWAADTICKEYDINNTKGRWALPTNTQLEAWATQIPKEYSSTYSILTRYMGSNGLDLCDVNADSEGDGNGRCPSTEAGCTSWNGGVHTCEPYCVWGKQSATYTGYIFYLNYNEGKIGVDETKAWAHSVRCVLSKVEDTGTIEEEQETITTVAPASQADCDKYGALYFKNACITKRNAGDTNGPSIEDIGIEILDYDESCTTNTCCWQGATASSGCKAYSSSGYSGCRRTVCTWWAANEICKNYNVGGTKGLWTLPTSTDLNNWKTQITKDVSTTTAVLTRFLGSNGIDLCDINADGDMSLDGNSICPTKNACHSKISGTEECYPSHVWGSQVDNTTARALYLSYDEGIISAQEDKTWPFSTRCVLKAMPVD